MKLILREIYEIKLSLYHYYARFYSVFFSPYGWPVPVLLITMIFQFTTLSIESIESYSFYFLTRTVLEQLILKIVEYVFIVTAKSYFLIFNVCVQNNKLQKLYA